RRQSGPNLFGLGPMAAERASLGDRYSTARRRLTAVLERNSPGRTLDRLDESERTYDVVQHARLLRQHSAILRQHSQELREELHQPLALLPRLGLACLICAECGREPREDENAEDDRRTYYEGFGDGVTVCPECAREIGAES